MPTPFQFIPIENFPIEPTPRKKWNTKKQLKLPDENIGDDAHSEISYVGVSDYLDYHKYYVRHETLRETWIRIDNEDRKKVIFVEEFFVFTPPNLTYAIVKAKHKIANELFRRIHDKEKSFDYLLREVDLIGLKNDLHSQVRGGWFRDLEIEDVSTAAIFGANVSDSDEWDKYANNGTLSSLVIEFSHRGERHSVNVSLSGAITLYANYDDVYSLDLVEKFNRIVGKHQKDVFVKKNQKGSTKIG